MNFTAMTVTVYFVGLVNLSGTGTTREVVAPYVPAPIPRLSKTLAAHGANIMIKGMKDPTKCGSIGGLLIFAKGGPVCAISPVSGAIVELPTSSDSLKIESGFDNIPKLTDLCPAVSGIDPAYLNNSKKYAVRLTLKSGKLDACVNGKSWGSYLVLNTASDQLKIGGKAVTLNPGAVIHIRNRPLVHTTTSAEEHFWWYYVMSKDAAACTGMPTTVPTGTACLAALPPGFPDPGHPAATGPGCSNSNYP